MEQSLLYKRNQFSEASFYHSKKPHLQIYRSVTFIKYFYDSERSIFT